MTIFYLFKKDKISFKKGEQNAKRVNNSAKSDTRFLQI